jgi:hypothetical protein
MPGTWTASAIIPVWDSGVDHADDRLVGIGSPRLPAIQSIHFFWYKRSGKGSRSGLARLSIKPRR